MDLPTFDTATLSSLTQKIETSFKGSKANPPNTVGKPKKAAKDEQHVGKNGEGSRGKKRTRDGKTKDQKPEGNGNDISGLSLPRKLPRSISKQQNATNGNQKRPLGGLRGSTTNSARNTKENDRRRPRPGNGQFSGSIDTKSSARLQSGPLEGKSKASLKVEIEALGGDEDDLKLIEGAASDSEVEGTQLRNGNDQLSEELLKYVKGLGIKSAASPDVESQDDRDGENQTQGQDQGRKENSHETEKIEGQKLGWKEEREVRKKAEKQAREKTTTENAQVQPPKQMQNLGSKRLNKVIYTPQSEWHTVPLPAIPVPSQTSTPQKELLDRLHEHAVSLLEADSEIYTTFNKTASSAHQFYSTIMSSGTLSDKISALTLSVQESPVHNVKALENLVSLARKRSRQQAVEVLGALKDLFGPGNVLPSDRKLRFFTTQPSLAHVFEPKAKWQAGDPLPGSLKEIHLVAWAYEDKLKSLFFEVLQIIETWCNDEVVFARKKAVDYLFELLRDKPEQEANLLRLLVNKLGDSDKSIASKTSYNLLQLQNTHPAMRMTVVSAIESDLLFRPGQSMHAKYYAVITLNQTVLGGREEAVAKKLLDIYFTMFVSLLKKPEVIKEVQQAPVQVKYNKKGEKQGGGGVPGKSAQKKLAELEKGKTVDEELREKLLSAVLTGVNRAMPYAKAEDEIFDKHMDTLFRVTHSSNFNTGVQALMLIQQLCGSRQAASSRFYRTAYESLLDSRLLTSSKQAMYLNLLFRALRADLSIKRVKAFAKRLLQVVMLHQASFTCGVIYLLRELESTFASLSVYVDQPEEDESDEEEEFHDVPEEGASELPARVLAIKRGQRSKLAAYDGRKREPEYSNAERSCLWEMVSKTGSNSEFRVTNETHQNPFLLHYHPSVSLLANNVLTHQPINAKPDLSSHTLIHFLDRFVYRNPKKPSSKFRGSSIMQPLESSDTSSLLLSAASMHRPKAPVNCEAYWNAKGDVDADEVFFHRYFNTLGKGKSKKEKKAEKKRKDAEDSGSEAEEEEIWKALVESQPDVEMEGSDSDLGFDGLDDDEGLGDVSSVAGDDHEQGATAEGIDEDDDAVEFDFDEGDDDALLGSEDEIEVDMDKAFEEEVAISTHEKGEEPEPRNKRRKRLKNLPTFASVEDYSKLLDQEEDEAL